MADGSRILIVDDEPGIRQVIKTNLVMQGHDTVEAKNGRQCLDVLAEELVDLVILDVMMPGTNGWEVLESMRDQPEMAGIPVMLLTAVSTEESKVKGFELGAADYLVKPFAIGELLARVQRILSEKQERDALAEFSITDWVTGLFNRRYLELRLSQEVSRSLRYKSPLTGIFFDIDQLPAINDHDGPQLIDAILGQLATLLRGHIRACDLVFRYDGDYFFLLLPDTDGVGGLELAERFRRKISSEHWAGDKALTASLGVVELAQGESPNSLMARAEEALQYAKSMGGDATWSAFGHAGGRAPEVAVEPAVVAEAEVTVAPALPVEPAMAVEPAVAAEPAVAVEPAVAAPAPVAQQIPLPTAQTQILNTGDLAALRTEIGGDSGGPQPPAYAPGPSEFAPQEAAHSASGWGAQQAPASPDAGVAPEAVPPAGYEFPAEPAPQPEYQQPQPEYQQPQPEYQQPQPEYQQPQPEYQQPQPEAPMQQAPQAPASWADAQILAASQFSVPVTQEPDVAADAPEAPAYPIEPQTQPPQQ